MNRLGREKSPYLKQHASNPVDWYPWGEEAFAAARRDGKPIFLSVGYSTCHWCHVMAHESFEDQGVAGILNRDFVPIKVDREERPDVDRVYMSFVQATTGSGGWPMSVWLTPDLKPFYGGTYFPPSSRWGRPGLREVLTEIVRVWSDDRDHVLESAALLTERLRSLERSGAADSVPGPAAIASAVARVRRGVRLAAWRIRTGSEIPAAERAPLSASRFRAVRRSRASRDGCADARGDGARRHARPHRRGLSSLFG